MIFDIIGIKYFQNGNVFTGSKGKFNLRIEPVEEKLEVAVWYGMFCYAKSEILTTNSFELSERGRLEMIAWLEEEYSVYLADASAE